MVGHLGMVLKWCALDLIKWWLVQTQPKLTVALLYIDYDTHWILSFDQYDSLILMETWYMLFMSLYIVSIFSNAHLVVDINSIEYLINLLMIRCKIEWISTWNLLEILDISYLILMVASISLIHVYFLSLKLANVPLKDDLIYEWIHYWKDECGIKELKA